MAARDAQSESLPASAKKGGSARASAQKKHTRNAGLPLFAGFTDQEDSGSHLLAPAVVEKGEEEVLQVASASSAQEASSPLAPAARERSEGGSSAVLDLDLSRHAVIGASAGTGKTYSLEHLVLRLLTETDARLDQILLVTYTEKAAGELKGRLRSRLEQAREKMPEHGPAIQAALDVFDQAPIYTIHGFCQRTLAEYAFEHRQDFRQELVQDVDVLQSCLREIQRRVWPQQYGDQLRNVLELSDYNGSKGAEAWERCVLRIATDLRAGCGHRLQPPPIANWYDAVRTLEPGLRAAWEQGRRLAGPLDIDRLEEHPWFVGFGKLPIREDWREPWRSKILVPLLSWLADQGNEARIAVSFYQLQQLNEDRQAFAKNGFLMLTDTLPSKARVLLPEYCPGLQELAAILEQRRGAIDWSILQHQLKVHTIQQLQEHLHDYKRERGLQSFEDMLTRVDDALDPAQNPDAERLAGQLRQRYRYAVIDEFQDTDQIQWRIFKRIFVEGGPGHRLFVVGDPKQAIFGFRGADLQAYLEAADELTRAREAQELHLDINWRSCPELLESLNVLFEQGEWFGATGITYRPVYPPPPETAATGITADCTGRQALTLVDISEAETLKQASRQFAQFTADEIARLLGGPARAPRLAFQTKDKVVRGLQEDDICVLVFKRKDAMPLLDALRAAHIPYSFYKQPGLWQSDEAVHLGYLLHALARPDHAPAFRKALLTRFFRIAPAELSFAEELSPHHPARELFERWLGFAEEQNWAPLFQSLLEDTGLLHHEPEAPDAERRLANCRHIFQTLQQAAYGENLDLLGVLDRLETLRRRPADNDADVQPIETEQHKVQIMTIHACKGLEFPVVFLAGGFTTGHYTEYLTYRDRDGLVFDLQGDDAARNAFRRERDAEQRRLLYVALTRSMFKLYVPRVATDRKYQGAGPVATILAPAAEKAGLPTASVAAPPAESIVVPPVVGSALPASPVIHCESFADLMPPADLDFRKRRILIRSFSSLHRQRAESEGPNFAERLPRGDDDRQNALADQDPLRGPVFGDLVHDVFEKIDFTAVGQAPGWQTLLTEGGSIRQLIDEQLARHLPRFTSRLGPAQLEEASRLQVARIVWNALHTPLSAAGGPLWQIPKEDRLHELEFHFPELEDTPPPEVRREEGFLTGFMDLIFRRGNQYFLADWKTNLLPGSYLPDELAESMRACDYTRQYRLYLQALARWLRRVHGDSFDPGRALGGVYYLYVRGMNGKDETAGVFFHRPSADDLRLEQVLAD